MFCGGPGVMEFPFLVGEMDRRALLRAGGAAFALLAIGGCGRAASPAGPQTMLVYRDPGCGCCEAWTELARQSGFAVQAVEHPDMAGLKRSKRVPDQLASCHTALVGGYVIEGHVPLEAVTRLLAARPAGLVGIAVPGMPRGSPGMEMPDGARDPFEVIAFTKHGATKVFG